MGGSNVNGYLSSCESYDIKMDEWTSMSPLNSKKYDASATILNKIIYLFGGNDGCTTQDSIEQYDIEYTKTWIVISVKL